MANHMDSKVSKLRSTLGLGNQVRSIQDLERDYYSSVSGLSPANSIANHKQAFFGIKGIVGKPLREAEIAYFKSRGAVGTSSDLITVDFYANRLFG